MSDFPQAFATAARLVSAAEQVQPQLFTSPKKGSPEVVKARQLMIYLLHTEGGFQQKQIADALHRHHSTVKHALDVIEERRDCASFDSALERLAGAFRSVVRPNAAPAVAERPAKLSDPFVTALTRALMLADLWRSGSTIETTREDARTTVGVFLPNLIQGDRQHDHERAQAIRRVLAEHLIAAGYRAVFTDAFWCAKGDRGWRVVAKGQKPNPHAPKSPHTAPDRTPGA